MRRVRSNECGLCKHFYLLNKGQNLGQCYARKDSNGYNLLTMKDEGRECPKFARKRIKN